MARNPEDGAEADPEGHRTLSTKPSDGASDQPTPALGQGEPSWPEDAKALRLEAVSEEGAGLDLPVAENEAGTPQRPEESSAQTQTENLESPDFVWTSSTLDGTSPTGAFASAGAGLPEDRAFETAERHEDPPTTGVARDEQSTEAPGRGALAPESYLIGATPQPVAPPPRRRGGAGALLLGGAAAAALGFGAAWFARDRWEPAPADLSAELEERLAALEARPLADDTEVQSLAERLSEAESRLEALEEAPAPAAETPAPVDLDLLREEVAAGLAQAEERAAELEERLASLEARPADPPTAAPVAGPALRGPDEADVGNEAVASLEPRLAAIESGTTEATAALSDVRAELELLETRVEASEATLAEIEARLGEAPAATEAALAELRTALEELRDNVGTNDTALAEIDTRLGEAEARLSEAEAAGASAVE